MATDRKTGTTPARTTRAAADKTVATTVAKAGPAKAPTAPTAPAAEPEATVVLRKKELFERVVEVSGAKKRDVKVVVEATLKVLGDALAAGETLALPPLGKAKVNRQKDIGSGEMLIVKLRRDGDKGDTETDPTEPLAAAAE